MKMYSIEVTSNDDGDVTLEQDDAVIVIAVDQIDLITKELDSIKSKTLQIKKHLVKPFNG